MASPMMAASTPLPVSRAATESSPSASTVNVTRMRAAPATIGGMPRSSKRASDRQSVTSSRSPCTTWIAIAVWPSAKGRELLRACDRYRRVARDDLLDQSAHGLEAERQRESRPAAASRRRPHDCPASRLACIAAPSATTLSGSMFVEGVWPKKRADRLAHMRHARRAADHHDTVDVRWREPGVLQAPCDTRPASCRPAAASCARTPGSRVGTSTTSPSTAAHWRGLRARPTGAPSLRAP